MPFKRAMIATVLLAMSAGAGLAMPAMVQNDLNLRAGPGTSYQIIDVMPEGSMVDAWNCGPNWCEVSYAGITGFASANYLNIGEAYFAPPAGTYVYTRPMAVAADKAGVLRRERTKASALAEHTLEDRVDVLEVILQVEIRFDLFRAKKFADPVIALEQRE